MGGVRSLLDRSAEEWIRVCGWCNEEGEYAPQTVYLGNMKWLLHLPQLSTIPHSLDMIPLELKETIDLTRRRMWVRRVIADLTAYNSSLGNIDFRSMVEYLIMRIAPVKGTIYVDENGNVNFVVGLL